MAALGLLILLWHVDPSRVRLYPGCPFYAISGLYCPSCGGIRALHALVHGQLAEAARCNGFLLLSIPVLTGAFYVWRKNCHRSVFLLLMAFWCVALILFWVGRNLPVHPFTLLVP